MRSEVQIFSDPPRRGHSSAGRAPALHAGGQEFDPPWLHHLKRSLLREQKIEHEAKADVRTQMEHMVFNFLLS